MKKFLLIIVLFFSFALISNSQNKDKDKKEQTTNTDASSNLVQPVVYKLDLVFLANALNTIELKATEVESFLEVQEKIKVFTDNSQFQAMNPEQQVKIEFDPLILDRIIIFSNRISLVGGDAVKYKRIILTFMEASKNFKQAQKPTK